MKTKKRWITLAKIPVLLCLAAILLVKLGAIGSVVVSVKGQMLKHAVRMHPDDANACFKLGLFYGESGRYEEAIEPFRQIVKMYPDDAQSQYNLGLAYDRCGRCEEAIEAYKTAIRLNPDFVDAHRNLGEVYLSLRRYEEAMKAFKAYQSMIGAATLHDLALSYNVLAWGSTNSKKYETAIEAFKHVLAIEPNDMDAYKDLGKAYVESGRYEEAIETYKQAISIKPDYVVALDGLAVAYAAAGKFDKAIATTQKAVEQARSTGKMKQVEDLQKRLESYKQLYSENDASQNTQMDGQKAN